MCQRQGQDGSELYWYRLPPEEEKARFDSSVDAFILSETNTLISGDDLQQRVGDAGGVFRLFLCVYL